MRPIFFILILILNAINSNGQYTVTKVVGNVTNKSTGESLKWGSHISDNDILKFSTPNDQVRLIVSGKGIIILTPDPKVTNGPGALEQIVKYTLHMNNHGGYLSGRGANRNFINEEMHTVAKVNGNILIENENKYLYDAMNFPTDNGNVFFLQVENDSAAQTIELPANHDTLYLNSSLFSSRADTSLYYQLGYYDKTNNKSSLIGSIHPVFDSLGEMDRIIHIFLASEPNKGNNDSKVACYNEIYEALGKPSYLTFNEHYQKSLQKFIQKRK